MYPDALANSAKERREGGSKGGRENAESRIECDITARGPHSRRKTGAAYQHLAALQSACAPPHPSFSLPSPAVQRVDSRPSRRAPSSSPALFRKSPPVTGGECAGIGDRTRPGGEGGESMRRYAGMRRGRNSPSLPWSPRGKSAGGRSAGASRPPRAGRAVAGCKHTS
jgi:hypothetical protein